MGRSANRGRKGITAIQAVVTRQAGRVVGQALAPVMGALGPRGDLIDQAAVQTEAELQIHLYQTDSRLSRAIEDALARINRCTFGACEACKQPISQARLEAVPWTRLCRECKEQERNPGVRRDLGWQDSL